MVEKGFKAQDRKPKSQKRTHAKKYKKNFFKALIQILKRKRLAMQ